MDINSLFSTNNQFVELVTKTSVSLKTITWICLRKNAAPTVLLDKVIYDVIDGLLNVSTSPNLLI